MAPIKTPTDFVGMIKDKLLKTGRVQASRSSMNWLGQKAQQALGDTVNNTLGPLNRTILKAVPTRRADKVTPGEMFFFVYDAKWKKKLQYFDKFPLIFPLEFYSDHFLGINLHYLEPGLRLKLLDTLMTLKNNDKFDETTKLQLSYQIVKDMSRMIKPTIHSYLYTHVKSKFIKVDSLEWHWVVLLPTEKFVDDRGTTTKAVSSRKVHQDSNKKM